MSVYGFVSVSAVSVCDEGPQCFECFDPLTALQRKVCVCVCLCSGTATECCHNRLFSSINQPSCKMLGNDDECPSQVPKDQGDTFSDYHWESDEYSNILENCKSAVKLPFNHQNSFLQNTLLCLNL